MSENINPQLNANPQIPQKVRVRTLETGKYLNRLMAFYFLKASFYTKTHLKYTAWTSSAFPLEFLWFYDVYPLHPENSATASGARRSSQKLIEYAESIGFSRDLCSYFKTNIGAYDTKIGLNYGGIGKPDFCCTTGAICDTHVKWFQTQARRMNVPLFIFDIPHEVSGSDEKTRERYIDYIYDQIMDYKDFMFDVTGKKFNDKKFFTIMRKSDRLAELWQEIYSYRKLKPSPLGFNDTFAQIFPLVIMPGIDAGIKYYEKLLAEVKKLAAEKKGIIPNEKYRVLFEGIPFWYRLKFLYDLAQYGISVVYEPYTFAFGPRKEIKPTIPESIRSFARTWLQQPYYYNLENRIKYFKQVIEEYQIDGVILHNNMSCRPNSTGLIDLKNAIIKDLNVPTIILESDMNDPRAYAEAPIKNRIESFVELMENHKKNN